MAQTLSASRLLSLRAPISGEGERAQFQQRLALTLAVVFVLAFGFWVIQLAAVVVTSPSRGALLFTHPSAIVQLATTFLALAGALWLRRGAPSVQTLDVADGALTSFVCLGWAAMIFADDRTLVGGELIALLATSYTLATRAALVPSTPARSALIGAMSMAPLVPLAMYLRSDVGPYGDRLALGRATYTAIWALVGTACTTTVSHVVYGLRLEVRRAMQLGQYVLEEKIGEGGMGAVYRARHALLRRPCAIKLLTDGAAKQATERFEREVQLTARLTHPNTVVVFDYGRTPDGVFYYAMELLDGITLEELVTLHGPQPQRRVVHFLLQICGALEEAHSAGLVHRDIKPANVMLTQRAGVRDVVKVLDFGLVKTTGQHTDPSAGGRAAILGTPQFMAPETIVDPAQVDGRADLYALGVVAFMLLTGEQLFEGTNLLEICSQHLHDEPPSPRSRCEGLSPELETVVLACLAKKPEDRPRDAADLADKLRACSVGEWTRGDAESWWTEVEPAKGLSLRARRSRDERVSGYARTVTVAMRDRS